MADPAPLLDPVDSPYLVPFDGAFCVAEAPTAPPEDAPGRRALKLRCENDVERLRDLQRMFHAADEVALLVVFQGLGGSGKDATIRQTFSRLDPAGVRVVPFGEPSARERRHDFLWRTQRHLPERGEIAVFNRGYYEDVIVVRVESDDDDAALWSGRYQSIRDHEQHLARNGTAILKFWLHHSAEAQRQRFLRRLEHADRHWRFGVADLDRRERWDDFTAAYEQALAETSRPWAPWYAIPADDKRFARATVAHVLVQAMQQIASSYPAIDAARQAELDQMRATLEADA